MKKILLFLLATQFYTTLFSQKKGKINFGFELGMSAVGLNPLTSNSNPLVQANNKLKQNIGFDGGIFTEFIKSRKKKNGTLAPGWGIKIKANYYYSEAFSENFTTDETINIAYTQVPVLFKICLGSGEVNVASSQSEDIYEVRRKSSNEYEVTHHPGQFSPGYRTTRSIFFYAGPQIGFINNIKYNSLNASDETAFETKKQNISNTYPSLIAGFEMWVGRIYFDLFYQKGVGSLYKGSNVTISGFGGKVGISF